MNTVYCLFFSSFFIFIFFSFSDIENAYVFLVNSQGITLMHPLLPSHHTSTEDPATVTIDKLEQQISSHSLLKKIVTEKSGLEVSNTNSYFAVVGVVLT